MNERNVCIGDIMSVGRPSTNGDDQAGETGLLLQVSLPRQPCFKLNHRFELKGFAPNTWRLSRTGWYYRVLREGTVTAGDEIKLVERPHPDWTIERVQEYLHRNTSDLAATEELAAIPEFGKECHDAFVSRAAKLRAKARREQGLPGDDEEGDPAQWRDFKIVDKQRQTGRITSFVLEAVDPLPEPEGVGQGSHAKVRIPVPGRAEPLVRAYSIVGGDRNRLELGVALEPASRGASRHLHETAAPGDVLQVGRITGMRLVTSCSSHVFVAGGVGITAFLPLLEELRRFNFDARLHYAVRSADDVPFAARVAALGADVVTIYDKSAGQRLCIRDIIGQMPWNSRLYFCGPRRMMEEAQRETRAAGVPANEVHFEAFQADHGGDPFEAVVVPKGGSDNADKEEVVVQVGADESLLEALRRRFEGDEQQQQLVPPSSCEVGNCGTCVVRLRAGRAEHRGSALGEEDWASGSMLSCVSRGVGRITIEMI
jgi:ferredoxin-NADP reductase